jgi:hypothetical protein
MQAITQQQTLASYVASLRHATFIHYEELVEKEALLPPIQHPDPAHMLITGTGLTHLGSADARDSMHKKHRDTPVDRVSDADLPPLTDSMRMFNLGLEGGKPTPGNTGVQPEWFYKGDGSCVTAPYQPLVIPDFALDGGEEPEIAGIYVIGPDGVPYRVGFCLGNEFSDHVMEKQNYLYLAHSKLRQCAFGPELLLGQLPRDIRGDVKILRNNVVLWQKTFLSGEENMSHSISNLEYHHFKYPGFRRPGDIHVHFFGTATLSFTDGVQLQAGDVVEIASDVFGHPLKNVIDVQKTAQEFKLKIL